MNKIRNFDDFIEYDRSHYVKNVILRCDLNLPTDIEDNSRIEAVRETIMKLLSMDKRIIVVAHFKRPKREDFFTEKYSLRKIADKMSHVLGLEVNFIPSNINDLSRDSIKSRLNVLENIRFYEGEERDDDDLAKKIASFGDAYINDAFSVSHRNHMSVSAITKYLPSFAGYSFEREILGISRVTDNIERPFCAIIGGSKVSTKIDVLKRISMSADYLVIAGAMANTFLKAMGHDLGNSMIEEDKIQLALEIYNNSKARIILPVDFMASDDINHEGKLFDIDKIPHNFSCFDIGTKSIENIIKIIDKSKTLLWNGALGAFEFSNFDISSDKISEFIARSTKKDGLISVIGGGETIASLKNFKNDMNFVSTAGGAFLELVAGYDLPGVKALLN